MLTEAALLGAAGDVVFDRGEDYTRYVRGVVVTGSRATATVQAKNVYQVQLSWARRELEGSCTCPHFAKGWFCKHLVAVGLVVIDEHLGGRTALVPEVILDTAAAADPVPAYLESLDAPALRQLVLRLAEQEPAAGTLELIAAMSTGRTEAAEQVIKAAAQDALRTRGFIDYRRSFEAAARAQLMLNELAAHLNAGGADLVRPALLYSVTRLRALLLHADDSGGVIGDACQQAADLYARSCREGSPDQAKLGRWLVKFRADSPGGRTSPWRTSHPRSGRRGWRRTARASSPSTRRTRPTATVSTGSTSTGCCSSSPTTTATWTGRSSCSPVARTRGTPPSSRD